MLDYRSGLVAWLDQCIECCEAESVRWFLRDFRSYVMERFEVSALEERG